MGIHITYKWVGFGCLIPMFFNAASVFLFRLESHGEAVFVFTCDHNATSTNVLIAAAAPPPPGVVATAAKHVVAI